MKKIRKPLILFAFATTAICALGLAAKVATNDAIPTFATYTNHDGDTYYNGISDSLSGTDLLSALQSLNSSKRQSTVGYSGMGTDPSGQFKYTDYDPNSVQYDSNGQPYGTKLITFYSGKSATSGMNREHVWPNSHGGNSVESDIHMPRPTLNAENGSRGNSFYVEGKCHSSDGWDPAMEDFGLVSYRGDSARIIFYCVVANKSLSLLEADSHPTSNKNRDNMMGRLSHLLKWNLENPVLDRERNRNEGAEYLQGNRNPFIDHPEYACKIWGNSNDETKRICQSVPPTPTKTLDSISVTGTPSKTTYFAGDSFDKAGLTVTANYSDKSTANVTSSVTVSPDPLTVGTTSVTLSYKYGSDTKTAVVSGITVNPVIPVTSVTINNSKKDYYINESCTLDTTVLPSNATNKSLTYTTSKSSVATVDASGNVSFKAAGSATITAKSHNNISASITFNVTKKQIPVTSIEASLPSSSYYVGNTADIQYTVKPTNADNKAVSFSSSDSSVATVSSSGHVSFLKAGEVTFTVKSAEDPSIIATINVTVSEKPVVEVPVESVIFDSCKTNVEVGESVQLFANVSPENATNKTLTYSSSNAALAEVSASGLVTFKASGSVTITAESNNGKKAIKVFTVSAVPTPESKLVEIAVTNKPEKLVYSVGETFSESGLEVEAHYLDGSSKDITGEVAVSSPNTSSAGTKTVTITYNETFKASFNIEVLEQAPSNLKLESWPSKQNYYVTEDFNPIGLKVTAQFGEEDRDVTNLVTFSYNFSISDKVKVIFNNLSLFIPITIEQGDTIPNEHKAADFAYILQDKVSNEKVEDVTMNEWNVLEYNYNKLDDGAKEVLKNTKTKYSGGAASAAEQLTQTLEKCAARYDEIYLANKAEGFNDFMGRNPQEQKQGLEKNTILILIGIGVGVVVLVAAIVIVAVVVSKKGKKKHA